jgi:hypothetical protein
VRFLRGLAAAASAAAAFGLATWAGHIGAASTGRGFLALGVAFLAVLVLSLTLPAFALGEVEDSGCALIVPAMFLVGATAWLTAVDLEVHTGQWRPVVVQDKRCYTTEGGCTWQFRVSDARTERDLGWLTCNDARLDAGDATRVHADPAGRHRPALEPCAHTTPGWTTGLHVVQGVWAAVLAGAFATAIRWLGRRRVG